MRPMMVVAEPDNAEAVTFEFNLLENRATTLKSGGLKRRGVVGYPIFTITTEANARLITPTNKFWATWQ